MVQHLMLKAVEDVGICLKERNPRNVFVPPIKEARLLSYTEKLFFYKSGQIFAAIHCLEQNICSLVRISANVNFRRTQES